MKKTINNKEYNVLNKEEHPQPVQQHITYNGNPISIYNDLGIISITEEEKIPDWILNQLK